MYAYFNPNPLNKRTGDCVIRALCKALNQNWDDTYFEVCVQGMKMCDMPSSNAVWGAYLKSKGFSQKSIPNACPDCYTIADFCIDYPEGVYVLGTGTHTVCVKDGCIFDSWDSSNEVPVYYFWR